MACVNQCWDWLQLFACLYSRSFFYLDFTWHPYNLIFIMTFSMAFIFRMQISMCLFSRKKKKNDKTDHALSLLQCRLYTIRLSFNLLLNLFFMKSLFTCSFCCKLRASILATANEAIIIDVNNWNNRWIFPQWYRMSFNDVYIHTHTQMNSVHKYEPDSLKPVKLMTIYSKFEFQMKRKRRRRTEKNSAKKEKKKSHQELIHIW